MIRAMFHTWLNRHDSEHRVWSEHLVWSGESGTVWFCTCGEQFWPVSKGGPNADWRDNPVKREPPN